MTKLLIKFYIYLPFSFYVLTESPLLVNLAKISLIHELLKYILRESPLLITFASKPDSKPDSQPDIQIGKHGLRFLTIVPQANFHSDFGGIHVV